MTAIDIKMTWQQSAHVIRAALVDGTPEGRRLATDELQNMARAADMAVDLQNELRRVTAELESLKAKATPAIVLDSGQSVILKHTCRTVAELRASLDHIAIADPDTLYLRTESGDEIDSVAVLEKPLSDGSFVYDIAFLTES